LIGFKGCSPGADEAIGFNTWAQRLQNNFLPCVILPIFARQTHLNIVFTLVKKAWQAENKIKTSWRSKWG
jgi:hypothetical protein